MGFTLEELDGYKQGERYEKALEFVEMFGNANNRSLVMKDEDGVSLLWTTRDSSTAYKNFKLKGAYTFTVKTILDVEDMSIPRINIGNVRVEK